MHKHTPVPVTNQWTHSCITQMYHPYCSPNEHQISCWLYFAPRLSPPSPCFPHSAWLAADSSRVCVCMARRPDTLPCLLSTVCVRDLPSRKAPLGLPDRLHTQISCLQNNHFLRTQTLVVHQISVLESPLTKLKVLKQLKKICLNVLYEYIP